VDEQLRRKMEVSEGQAKYDAATKRVLSEKSVLAYILKRCTPEFADVDETEIRDCIEGDPIISGSGVEPDMTRIPGGDAIQGMNTESVLQREGTVKFDILFQARVPGTNERVGLIINLEAQLNTAMRYPLVKRGQYYVSRLISAQKEQIFRGDHYEKLRKVYSIWICPNPEKQEENSIVEYSINEKVLCGESRVKKSDYDLQTILMIFLATKENESEDNELLKFLEVLLSSGRTAEEKERIFGEELSFSMNDELKDEVDHMCNLSDLVIEQGLEKGEENAKFKYVEHMLKMNRDEKDIMTCYPEPITTEYVNRVRESMKMAEKPVNGAVFKA